MGDGADYADEAAWAIEAKYGIHPDDYYGIPRNDDGGYGAMQSDQYY